MFSIITEMAGIAPIVRNTCKSIYGILEIINKYVLMSILLLIFLGLSPSKLSTVTSILLDRDNEKKPKDKDLFYS